MYDISLLPVFPAEVNFATLCGKAELRLSPLLRCSDSIYSGEILMVQVNLWRNSGETMANSGEIPEERAKTQETCNKP